MGITVSNPYISLFYTPHFHFFSFMNIVCLLNHVVFLSRPHTVVRSFLYPSFACLILNLFNGSWLP